MTEFSNLDNLEHLAIVASILVAVGTIAIWFWTGFRAIRTRLRSMQVKSGIYSCFWVDPVKKELHVSTVKLKKFGGSINVSVLYAHSERHNFRMKLKPLGANKSIYSGNWKAKGGSTLYQGPAMFRFHSNQFDGRWIGPKRNLEINAGKFKMRHLVRGNNSYVAYKNKDITRILPMLSSGESIQSIIHKHEANKDDQIFRDGDVTISIPAFSFQPNLGKISNRLLRYLCDLEMNISSILDIGTGAGLYAIYLARFFGASAIGVEIDFNLINTAQANARSNNSGAVKFLRAEKYNPFVQLTPEDKFDLVVADLPFSRFGRCWRSAFNPRFRHFCSNRKFLESVVLGSAYHINPNGHLIFTYGDSGYKEFLDDLIEISPWVISNFEEIRDTDDIFYIYDLALGPDVLEILEERTRIA